MDWNLAPLALTFTLGAMLGYVSGMLGIGGGLLAIPILALGYGMDQQTAQGTALVLMTPNMIIGFWRYRQHNPITFGMAASLGIGSMIASYLAALVVTQVSTGLLRTLVSLFMIVLAVNLMWRSLRPVPNATVRQPASLWFLPFVGCIGGFCSGFFTIGGGIVVVPILTGFFGFVQTAAQGLALAMLAPGSLIALLAYAHNGLVDWAV
ncbi:MAG: sulfite exporter TauE/SafE family protein, partial [Burkholderiaceae bacterium]|nr:sulfite exporter TauE/SafE family protein [Burkholderiaceae bacterium]